MSLVVTKNVNLSEKLQKAGCSVVAMSGGQKQGDEKRHYFAKNLKQVKAILTSIELPEGNDFSPETKQNKEKRVEIDLKSFAEEKAVKKTESVYSDIEEKMKNDSKPQK